MIEKLNEDDVAGMRAAGKLAAQTLQYAGSTLRAGMKTIEIDRLVHEFTLDHGAVPAPLGYHGFPNSVCTSVNSCVCHGVPGEEELKDGDIINVDVTPILNGYHGDTSATFFIGEVSEEVKKLVEIARLAMERGIEAVRPHGTTGDVGFAINKFVTKKGFLAVKDIGGHGIGKKFHQDPFVPSYGKKGRGERLLPWTCITVEPMVNQGVAEVIEKKIPGSDIKYYSTTDGGLSAQFEHTLLITDTGYEILTQCE